MVTVNPATGEFLREYQVQTADWLELRVTKSNLTFKDWSLRPLTVRLGALQRLEMGLKRERESLARSMAIEMGKPLAQGLAEVDKSAHTLNVLREQYPKWLQAKEYKTKVGHSVHCSPLGPLLGIMPWNFPLWQVIRFAVPALLNGNTILLKHAPNTWGTAELIEDLFAEAFPENAYIHIPIDHALAARVIADMRIRGVSLTGSKAAGQVVGELCGRHLKPVVLELGGSDAYVVLDDADVDLASEICVAARLQNTGQSCIAGKRFIVHRAKVKEFTEKMIAKMSEKKSGDPLLPGVDLGPMARIDLRDQLHDQVTRSLKAGAELKLGGQIPKGPGAFYPATVLTKVAPGMSAFDEELFGPVAAIIEAGSDKEAIRLANQSEYGLGGAIFSRDVERARKLALDDFDCGMVAINDYVRSDVLAPFGGIKNSGLGRELGPEGCFAFVNIKTIKS